MSIRVLELAGIEIVEISNYENFDIIVEHPVLKGPMILKPKMHALVPRNATIRRQETK